MKTNGSAGDTGRCRRRRLIARTDRRMYYRAIEKRRNLRPFSLSSCLEDGTWSELDLLCVPLLCALPAELQQPSPSSSSSPSPRPAKVDRNGLRVRFEWNETAELVRAKALVKMGMRMRSFVPFRNTLMAGNEPTD